MVRSVAEFKAGYADLQFNSKNSLTDVDKLHIHMVITAL